MKRLLDEVKRAKFTFEVNAEELTDLEKILEKDRCVMGKESEEGCRCPRCEELLVASKKAFFCPWCGQRVLYVENEDIPL